MTELARRAIELRVGLGGVDLPQEHLAVGPRQVEDAVRETPILVFLDQAQARVAGFADAGDHIDRCRFFRFERDPVPDGDNRIEHGALAARERRRTVHRLRIGDGVAAADEPHAVGLIGNLFDLRAMHGHQVKHPGGVFVEGAGPASAENRPVLVDDLGLNKEIAERRMQCVRGRRCQDHFRVTRHVDRSARSRAVGDGDAAQFDIILRRNNDLGMGVEVMVAAAELGSPFRKNRLVMLRSFERRLICG